MLPLLGPCAVAPAWHPPAAFYSDPPCCWPSTEALNTVIVEAEALSIVSEGRESYRVPLTSTATRLDLAPRETPQSVSTVTRAQIDDFNLDTTNDVLESTPGDTVERLETDRTYYTARGFEILNFQVDGLRVPMPYNNVHGDMDTAIHDRVEVVRGAAGLMSGSGNPAATVNFVRKRPTYEPQASRRPSAPGTSGAWKPMMRAARGCRRWMTGTVATPNPTPGWHSPAPMGMPR